MRACLRGGMKAVRRPERDGNMFGTIEFHLGRHKRFISTL